MVVFENTEKWQEKVNFVDENDVVVGYDLSQNCCEHANWFIADKVTPYSYDFYQTETHERKDLSGYVFDIDFIEEVESSDLDSGGMVVFKLVAIDKPDLYLHIFNSHNGYYAHGFEVKHGGVVIRDGYL